MGRAESFFVDDPAAEKARCVLGDVLGRNELDLPSELDGLVRRSLSGGAILKVSPSQSDQKIHRRNRIRPNKYTGWNPVLRSHEIHHIADSVTERRRRDLIHLRARR